MARLRQGRECTGTSSAASAERTKLAFLAFMRQ